MELMDLLSQTGGIQSMASELGVSESQAANGAAAQLPATPGGFKKQARRQLTGPEGLAGMLGGRSAEAARGDARGLALMPTPA